MAEGLHDITENRDVLIPMTDGIELAANLILPEGAPPAPAIIVYHPYLKDLMGRGAILDWQRHFARRGYACLTVDMRGTGGSGGTMAPSFAASEKEDAVVMLDWIARQPWCDGNTGMWGISYSGSSALAAASLRPPSLKAIVPLHGTANEYWGFLNPHGCRPAWWTEASWGPMMILFSLLPPLHRDAGGRWARIWRERLDNLDPVPFAWHRTDHDTYMGWKSDAGQVEAAMYAVSGWHDYYPQATFDFFNAAGGPKRILIGEWKHEFPDLAVRGGVDHLAEMDRWWDRWLRGKDNGAEADPPVLVWHQGAARWRAETAWPPASSQMEKWFAGPGGSLEAVTPGETGKQVFTVDPASGFDLLPWDPQVPITPMPFDRSGDDHRGLFFDSAPLEQAIDIVGSPHAFVALSSDVADFPLHVALCDVAPDGHSSLICQGWARTTLAEGGPLTAGVPATLRVPLYATSYRLPAGHRLRLAINGADFPLLWPACPNPTIAIAHGAQATRLELPVAALDDSEPVVTLLRSPAHREAGGKTSDRAVNSVTRDLAGQTATFNQLEDSSQVLEDGTVVHQERHNWSTVVRDRPDASVLSARMTARVERDGDRVAVLVETVQTRDAYHVEASIERGGRAFYHRTWTLPLEGR